MSSTPAPSQSQIALLKHQLHITPKTATLLIRAGYADYTSLAAVSPEHVSKQFQRLLNLSDKHAYSYKRALRQIVWLGTQKHPETFGKNCRDWSDRALRKRGLWRDGFDGLAGWEIEELVKGEMKLGGKVKEEETKVEEKTEELLQPKGRAGKKRPAKKAM
jgi:hypothetical protein